MNDQRRSRSTLFLTAVAGIAVVAGACSSTGKPAPTAEASEPAAHGTAAASSRPASPESALAGTLRVVRRRGDTDCRIVDAGTNEEMMTVPIGATTPTWSRILSASPGTSSTALRETVLSSGVNGPDSTIQGRWQVPTMGSDPVPVGRSANGA